MHTRGWEGVPFLRCHFETSPLSSWINSLCLISYLLVSEKGSFENVLHSHRHSHCRRRIGHHHLLLRQKIITSSARTRHQLSFLVFFFITPFLPPSILNPGSLKYIYMQRKSNVCVCKEKNPLCASSITPRPQPNSRKPY